MRNPTENLRIAKMSTLITSFGGEMGSTIEGKGWVLKALHPADPITDCRGIPDKSACATVMITYNSVFRVSPPVGATSWGFDLTVIPDAIAQACMVVTDSAGLIVGMNNFLNQALTPPGVSNPSYAQLLAQLRVLGIEAHRLVYMGVTAYQDGPALADQGTIVAAQWEVARTKYSPYVGTATTPVAMRRVVGYTPGDFASYSTSQYMPNAYFGPSKGGCYLPLRLAGNNRWITDADLELFTKPIPLTEEGDNVITLPVSMIKKSAPAYTGAAPGATLVLPYPSLIAASVTEGLPPILRGDAVYRPMNDVWGGISTANLSPQTSFAFYVRCAIECRVQPASVLASQLRMSPAYDPVAMAAYARLSRELKDAYPSDYNDLGKLWEVIKSAARVVLPVLGGFGPVGAAISAGGGAVMSTIDAIGRARAEARSAQGRGTANKPPAASVERLQDAVHAGKTSGAVRKARKKIAKGKKK